VVGKSVIRKDALTKVTGEAIFADDMRFENMLYGKVFRSKVPHAILKNVNIKDAISLPGVKAVLTHKAYFQSAYHQQKWLLRLPLLKRLSG
jgi:CO/xanthine dehydrogenase Mo-binding subunit